MIYHSLSSSTRLDCNSKLPSSFFLSKLSIIYVFFSLNCPLYMYFSSLNCYIYIFLSELYIIYVFSSPNCTLYMYFSSINCNYICIFSSFNCTLCLYFFLSELYILCVFFLPHMLVFTVNLQKENQQQPYCRFNVMFWHFLYQRNYSLLCFKLASKKFSEH